MKTIHILIGREISYSTMETIYFSNSILSLTEKEELRIMEMLKCFGGVCKIDLNAIKGEMKKMDIKNTTEVDLANQHYIFAYDIDFLAFSCNELNTIFSKITFSALLK